MRLNQSTHEWIYFQYRDEHHKSPLIQIILRLLWFKIHNSNVGWLIGKISSKIDCHPKQRPIWSICISGNSCLAMPAWHGTALMQCNSDDSWRCFSWWSHSFLVRLHLKLQVHAWVVGWAYMVTLSKIHYMPGNPMEGMSNIYKSPNAI
jgi:hypothetical protein